MEWGFILNFFEENIQIIRGNSNHIIMEIENKDLQYKFLGIEKKIEFFVDKDENLYAAKSEIDNENLPYNLKRELYFIIGLNGTEEIEYLIKNSNANSYFIIIEPDPSFFYHVLNAKNLNFLARKNVKLIVQEVEHLQPILLEICTSPLIKLLRNIRFYGTYFYRHNDSKKLLEIVRTVSSYFKRFIHRIGNSLDDSIRGLSNNLHNLSIISKSKNISLLKNKFKGVPAIIVSAGPSLDKNIKLLKDAKGKSIIIAADTIVQKLLNEGIIPDFMCSVERDEVVYEYFYKGQAIPENVTLCAPIVVDPKIINTFPGKNIIGLKTDVYQDLWLGNLLNFNGDYFISMGSSCAHLAFGLAAHLGAEPIVLVGQDLAYSSDGKSSHSTGTIYDEEGSEISQSLYQQEIFEVEGYYGKPVKTYDIWDMFRKWFETEITTKGLYVINATEGGAKIAHTIQLSLKEVIEKYCKHEMFVSEVISELPDNNLNNLMISKSIQNEVNILEEIQGKLEEINKEFIKIKKDFDKITPNSNTKKLYEILSKMEVANEVLILIYKHKLLNHIMLPELARTFWELYKIEEILTYENVKRNLILQKDFIRVFSFVVETVKNRFNSWLSTS
jgi:hypothetical protein